MKESFYVRRNRKKNLVEPLVMGTRTWIFFCHSKVFRLHAILHDAAEAVRSKSNGSTGYCYTFGRGPNSSLFGPVIVLPFCHWESFLNIQFKNRQLLKHYVMLFSRDRVFFYKRYSRDRSFEYWAFQRYSFCPQKIQTHKKSILVHKKHCE